MGQDKKADAVKLFARGKPAQVTVKKFTFETVVRFRLMVSELIKKCVIY